MTSEAIVHKAVAEGYGVQRFDGRDMSSSGAHNADSVWPRPDNHSSFIPPVCPFLCDRTYGNSNRFRRASPVARPSHGGEKRVARRVSPHEALWRLGGCLLPCAPSGLPLQAVWYLIGAPLGAAVDASRDAAAQAPWAARAAHGGVVSVPQALHVPPSALPMTAPRAARCGHGRTRNSLPPEQ